MSVGKSFSSKMAKVMKAWLDQEVPLWVLRDATSRVPMWVSRDATYRHLSLTASPTWRCSSQTLSDHVEALAGVSMVLAMCRSLSTYAALCLDSFDDVSASVGSRLGPFPEPRFLTAECRMVTPPSRTGSRVMTVSAVLTWKI